MRNYFENAWGILRENDSKKAINSFKNFSPFGTFDTTLYYFELFRQNQTINKL